MMSIDVTCVHIKVKINLIIFCIGFNLIYSIKFLEIS